MHKNFITGQFSIFLTKFYTRCIASLLYSYKKRRADPGKWVKYRAASPAPS